jgi:excisionase family DNA binding protein
MIDKPRAFTVATLAKRWSCSTQHVRNLISRGELRCCRIGRLIRIPAEIVHEFEERGLHGGASGERLTFPRPVD